MPEFWRLLELRAVSQFGDGLFQAGLAGGLLFNPERAAGPWEIAGAFAVLYLPYSLLGPFAGALLDRWDRRLVLVGANLGRLVLVLAVGTLLAAGVDDLPILFGALIVNGFTRFVSSGLSAALPDVVPREQVVAMNAVASATGAVAAVVGATFMLLVRWLFGADDTGAAAIIFIVTVPVSIALLLSVRFSPHVLGPHESVRAIHGSVAYAVATGWVHGARTVFNVPTVAATLSGLAAHRVVFGINTLLVLVIVRHTDTQAVAGLGTAVLFAAATGTGSLLATLATPAAVGRWGRYRTANGALALCRDHPARRGRAAAADDGAVRVPARRGRTGGEAVRGHRHADRRRRRAARARVHRAGLAVLGLLHRRDGGVGGVRHPRRRVCPGAGPGRRRRLPDRAGGARRHRSPSTGAASGLG